MAKQERTRMRGLVLTTVTALGIGLLGLSGASAVPANGIAVSQATAAEQSIQPHDGVITIVGAGTAGGAGNRATLLAAPWPVTPSSHREPRHGH
jgi:hypothetical protein